MNEGVKVEKNSLYHEVVQRYLTIEKRLANLRRERDCLDKQIEIYEEESYSINDILCKHGKHIYERFIEVKENGE